MNVNFILTGGDLTPGYCRAIKSARVHNAPIILWHVTESRRELEQIKGNLALAGCECELRHLPTPDWLRPEHQCHIYDVLAYHIGYVHGGMVLGLDTVSVRCGWDLLADHDVVVSRDWPAVPVGDVEGSPANLAYPYNNNFIARKGSDGALALFTEAKRTILNEPEKWGITGPWMLSRMVDGLQIAGCEFPELCGFAPGYLWRFYLGLEPPPPTTRVIHLCRTAYLALYERRFADWAAVNPAYAGEVAKRTNLNDHLLC